MLNPEPSWVARDLNPDWSLVPSRPSSEEIAPGFLVFAGGSNNYAIETDEGLLIVDPGHERLADAFHEAVRAWSTAPVHTVALTHGHMDHASGFGRFAAEGERPIVIAQENYTGRIARYRQTYGFNQHINRRQFASPDFTFPTDFIEPTLTYADELVHSVGGLELQFRAVRGETDDYSVIWIPSRGILFVGDNATWKVPNAGNPLKVQRFPVEWVGVLESMAELDAEWLCPGHDLVLCGKEPVRSFLTAHAQYLRSLVDQVRDRMNEGQTYDEILHGVKPDPELAELPFIRAVYNHPEFVVRDLLRYWGGWWDGVGGNLLPAPLSVQATEIVRLAGGIDVIINRARGLADQGELKLACHLIDWATAAGRESLAVQQARRDIYSARMEAETIGMPKGFFRSEVAEAEDSIAQIGGG